MTNRSLHASGSASIATLSTVVAVVVSMLASFHRFSFWPRRNRQVPALGSCYGVVVG
jgi:hypothetical protein